MTQLRDATPRPRSSCSRPAYPRLLGAGLVALATIACGGSVEGQPQAQRDGPEEPIEVPLAGGLPMPFETGGTGGTGPISPGGTGGMPYQPIAGTAGMGGSGAMGGNTGGTAGYDISGPTGAGAGPFEVGGEGGMAPSGGTAGQAAIAGAAGDAVIIGSGGQTSPEPPLAGSAPAPFEE